MTTHRQWMTSAADLEYNWTEYNVEPAKTRTKHKATQSQHLDSPLPQQTTSNIANNRADCRGWFLSRQTIAGSSRQRLLFLKSVIWRPLKLRLFCDGRYVPLVIVPWKVSVHLGWVYKNGVSVFLCIWSHMPLWMWSFHNDPLEQHTGLDVEASLCATIRKPPLFVMERQAHTSY
jgi:hypothetical protein